MQYTEAKQAGHFYNRRDLEQLKYNNTHIRGKIKRVYILGSQEI